VGFAADGRTLYCVDLGSDRIWAFAVGDADTPLPPPSIAYRAPAGSGPRHLAFHPTRPVAFLVSELASTLTMLMIGSDGALEPRVTASTVPEGVSGSLGGAVATNRAGDRVYVTNRGHDSVAVFGIEDDALVLLQHVGTRGKSPRFILLMDDEARLLVANEEGGGVSIFAVRPDGTLSPCPHTLDVNGAVFLAEMPSSIARPSAWPS
jgi:6-phosphogluconolactonase